MKRKISLVGLACLLLIACFSDKKFQYREHYDQLRDLTKSTAIHQGIPNGNMYEFDETLNYWIYSGWIDAIWDTLESKFDISQVYFIVESGNSTWPYYESRSIIGTKNGPVLVEVNPRPDTLQQTMGVEVRTKKIGSKDYLNISSDLKTRFHVFELKSSLMEVLTYDANVGFCSASYDGETNRFLLFDIPDVVNDTAREMLHYVDSIFNIWLGEKPLE